MPARSITICRRSRKIGPSSRVSIAARHRCVKATYDDFTHQPGVMQSKCNIRCAISHCREKKNAFLSMTCARQSLSIRDCGMADRRLACRLLRVLGSGDGILRRARPAPFRRRRRAADHAPLVTAARGRARPPDARCGIERGAGLSAARAALPLSPLQEPAPSPPQRRSADRSLRRSRSRSITRSPTGRSCRPPIQKVLDLNNTFVGRITIGPAVMAVGFVASEIRLIAGRRPAGALRLAAASPRRRARALLGRLDLRRSALALRLPPPMPAFRF